MIVIDSDNYAEHGIETFFFPGGEPHVKIPKFRDELVLFLKLRTWNDVGFAALLIDALGQQGASFDTFIPYMPGARQDRTDGKSPLTLKVMSRVLDLWIGDHVFDPHSDVLETIVPVQVWMPRHLPVPVRSNVAGIIAPDAGAVNRATEFRDAFYPGKPVIACSKTRDFESGKFLGYELPSLPGIGHYIVVDDICDGGGTFNLLAQEFVKDPAGRAQTSSLELFVSHGIFSQGLDAISPLYQHITTTDSWCRAGEYEGSRLEVIALLPALKEHLSA